MEGPVPQPHIINRLRFGTDSAFAMLAGMQLDVFTPLKAGSMTAEQIGDAIGVGPARLSLLLYALVAAGLLIEKDGRFSNTPEAKQYLVKDSPTYLRGIDLRLFNQWGEKLKTAESIRTGIPQAHLNFSNASPEDLEAFLRRISPTSIAVAQQLTERYDFSSAKTLVDVASGAGGLAITLTKANPHIQATAIDLPLVTPITQKIVDEEGATDHIKVITTDVVSSPMPGSYDIAVVQSLLQVLSSEDARRAVNNIGAAINPGGTIYIVGQILDDSRASPPDAIGFNLIFVNTYYTGEAYTEQEHRDWLSEAGFVDIDRGNILLAGSGLGEWGLITARKRA